MPLFIDHHEKLPPMPAERAQEVRHLLQSGERDQNGTKGVNMYLSDDGQTWCLFDAPNADAVINAHRASGVPVEADDIVQVNSIL